jgi:hypothetical protein
MPKAGSLQNGQRMFAKTRRGIKKPAVAAGGKKRIAQSFCSALSGVS